MGVIINPQTSIKARRFTGTAQKVMETILKANNHWFVFPFDILDPITNMTEAGVKPQNIDIKDYSQYLAIFTGGGSIVSSGVNSSRIIQIGMPYKEMVDNYNHAELQTRTDIMAFAHWNFADTGTLRSLHNPSVKSVGTGPDDFNGRNPSGGVTDKKYGKLQLDNENNLGITDKNMKQIVQLKVVEQTPHFGQMDGFELAYTSSKKGNGAMKLLHNQHTNRYEPFDEEIHVDKYAGDYLHAYIIEDTGSVDFGRNTTVSTVFEQSEVSHQYTLVIEANNPNYVNPLDFLKLFVVVNDRGINLGIKNPTGNRNYDRQGMYTSALSIVYNLSTGAEMFYIVSFNHVNTLLSTTGMSIFSFIQDSPYGVGDGYCFPKVTYNPDTNSGTVNMDEQLLQALGCRVADYEFFGNAQINNVRAYGYPVIPNKGNPVVLAPRVLLPSAINRSKFIDQAKYPSRTSLLTSLPDSLSLSANPENIWYLMVDCRLVMYSTFSTGKNFLSSSYSMLQQKRYEGGFSTNYTATISTNPGQGKVIQDDGGGYGQGGTYNLTQNGHITAFDNNGKQYGAAFPFTLLNNVDFSIINMFNFFQTQLATQLPVEQVQFLTFSPYQIPLIGGFLNKCMLGIPWGFNLTQSESMSKLLPDFKAFTSYSMYNYLQGALGDPSGTTVNKGLIPLDIVNAMDTTSELAIMINAQTVTMGLMTQFTDRLPLQKYTSLNNGDHAGVTSDNLGQFYPNKDIPDYYISLYGELGNQTLVFPLHTLDRMTVDDIISESNLVVDTDDGSYPYDPYGENTYSYSITSIAYTALFNGNIRISFYTANPYYQMITAPPNAEPNGGMIQQIYIKSFSLYKNNSTRLGQGVYTLNGIKELEGYPATYNYPDTINPPYPNNSYPDIIKVINLESFIGMSKAKLEQIYNDDLKPYGSSTIAWEDFDVGNNEKSYIKIKIEDLFPDGQYTSFIDMFEIYKQIIFNGITISINSRTHEAHDKTIPFYNQKNLFVLDRRGMIYGGSNINFLTIDNLQLVLDYNESYNKVSNIENAGSFYKACFLEPRGITHLNNLDYYSSNSERHKGSIGRSNYDNTTQYLCSRSVTGNDIGGNHSYGSALDLKKGYSGTLQQGYLLPFSVPEVDELYELAILYQVTTSFTHNDIWLGQTYTNGIGFSNAHITGFHDETTLYIHLMTMPTAYTMSHIVDDTGSYKCLDGINADDSIVKVESVTFRFNTQPENYKFKGTKGDDD